jgi:hypothetical protein
MTDKLQPMDLAVNAALKAHMRKFRGEHLYQQVQTYNASGSPLDFNPSPPKISDGLNMVMNATTGLFQEQNFKNNLSNTFYKVGLAKRDGGYMNYTGLDVIKRKKTDTAKKIKGEDKAKSTEEPPLHEIISNLALDHTIARAEGDRGVADFDQEDDEEGQEKGDEMVDDWCNEALEDGSYVV